MAGVLLLPNQHKSRLVEITTLPAERTCYAVYQSDNIIVRDNIIVLSSPVIILSQFSHVSIILIAAVAITGDRRKI